MKKTVTISSFIAFFCLSIAFLPVPTVNANEECSRQDLKKIRSFDRKAKRVQQEMEELRENIRPSRSDIEDIEDTAGEMDELEDFFSSDEYESMRPLYEKCGKPMPTMNTGYAPFWMPNN